MASISRAGSAVVLEQSVPIVVVTGRDDRRTMQEAFEIGATFFITETLWTG